MPQEQIATLKCVGTVFQDNPKKRGSSTWVPFDGYNKALTHVRGEQFGANWKNISSKKN